MIKRLLGIVTVLVLALALAGGALAQTLDQAKSQGLIGERIDGYVGVVDAGAPAEIRALADRVNGERRAEFERLAGQQGVEVPIVAQLVGERQIQRAPAGTYILGADGVWRRK